jgi:hypothetical protein
MCTAAPLSYRFICSERHHRRPFGQLQPQLSQKCDGTKGSSMLKDMYRVSKSKRTYFRIGELNPGLVGTDHLAVIESDKS